MPPLEIIFRTQSDIEASIVRGLLESHGIHSLTSSDVPHSVFPLSVDGLGEVRIAVRPADADEASRIIEVHRSTVASSGHVPLDQEFAELERRVGHRFRDRGLLEHALTHRSRAHEDASGGVIDNESMEFLGDSVLGLVVADLLFHEFPQHDEGDMSKFKASLVSTASLATLAERLDLGQHILLGRGEERSGGRTKVALLADTYEAVIAALYLDGGLAAARAFLERELRPRLDEILELGVASVRDHKSALQEWLQAHGRPLPEYAVVGEHGPDHRKQFEVEVLVDGQALARESGRSKKTAEQSAARTAMARLEEAQGATEAG